MSPDFNHDLNTTVAALAIASPWWLQTASTWAASLLPIMGVCWLAFQFILKLYSLRKK